MKGKWKQNSKKKKNAVLQKYMAAVGEFVKSENGTEEEERDHVVRFVKKKSRKELRKEKRKLKKAKMKSHYEGNKTLSSPCGDDVDSGLTQTQVSKKKKKKTEKAREVSKTHAKQSVSAPVENSKTRQSSKKGKNVNKLQESRKLALQEANEQEDREIKKLERCLGLNKRKNKKSLPQSFVADGLDYILGVLDSGSSAGAVYDDDDDMDMAKANFEKLDENDSELSDGNEMASEVSDEDMSSFDEEEEDEMVDEVEAPEEEMEDDQEEMDESDENEGETNTPYLKKSESKSESVS